MKKLLAGLAIAAIATGCGAAGTSSDQPTTTTTAPTMAAPITTPDAAGLAATLVSTPDLVAQFCKPYNNALGLGFSDKTVFGMFEAQNALEGFAPFNLSDREVFDTLKSYCEPTR